MSHFGTLATIDANTNPRTHEWAVAGVPPTGLPGTYQNVTFLNSRPDNGQFVTSAQTDVGYVIVCSNICYCTLNVVPDPTNAAERRWMATSGFDIAAAYSFIAISFSGGNKLYAAITNTANCFTAWNVRGPNNDRELESYRFDHGSNTYSGMVLTSTFYGNTSTFVYLTNIFALNNTKLLLAPANVLITGITSEERYGALRVMLVTDVFAGDTPSNTVRVAKNYLYDSGCVPPSPLAMVPIPSSDLDTTDASPIVPFAVWWGEFSELTGNGTVFYTPSYTGTQVTGAFRTFTFTLSGLPSGLTSFAQGPIFISSSGSSGSSANCRANFLLAGSLSDEIVVLSLFMSVSVSGSTPVVTVSYTYLTQADPLPEPSPGSATVLNDVGVFLDDSGNPYCSITTNYTTFPSCDVTTFPLTLPALPS